MTDKELRCPKCGAYSGDDWSQCEGSCPMPMSPFFSEEGRCEDEGCPHHGTPHVCKTSGHTKSDPSSEDLRAIGFTTAALAFPRDDLALRLLAAFNNVDVEKLPRGAAFFPNESTRAAWDRVAKAAAEQMASHITLELLAALKDCVAEFEAIDEGKTVVRRALAVIAKLESTATRRDTVMGDPCGLIEAKSELWAAAADARAIINNVEKVSS